MWGLEGRGRAGPRASGFERWALTGERVAEDRRQHRAQEVQGDGPRGEGLRWPERLGGRSSGRRRVEQGSQRKAVEDQVCAYEWNLSV